MRLIRKIVGNVVLLIAFSLLVALLPVVALMWTCALLHGSPKNMPRMEGMAKPSQRAA